MKKLIVAVVLCVMMCSLLLTGCTCDHKWTAGEDTATCQAAGHITYTCSKCGDTYNEDTPAREHNYRQTADTATCTEAGEKTLQCTKCNQTKTEASEAKGHFFTKYGSCSRCKIFKYNITVTTPLPDEFARFNGKTIYSKCRIDKVTMEIQDDYLILFFYGEKTYDWKGEYVDTSVGVTYIIRDEEDNIVYSGTLSVFSLVVGQALGTNGYKGIKTVKESVLKTDKQYTIQLVDYEI